MRVSLGWLNDYVDIKDIPSAELAHRLTMAGLAVEAIEEEEGDTVLELELTPNRGDCNGMINVAREVAALFERPLRLSDPVPAEKGEGRASDMIRVTIEAPQLCRRYAARVITDIKIEPSPDWMQFRLQRAGIRPINNIVDITNYVMLEYNQPLHAFDYSTIAGSHIKVRQAKEGETFCTLDEVERTLNKDMLVIADEKKALALAGVMGGLNSEISPLTRTVLLESANFDPVNVRRTSVRLALRTEASARFEKGADPETVIPAINRAACLIEELGAGRVVPGIVDVYPVRLEKKVITLRPERVNKLLGTKISTKVMLEYLTRLGFEVEPMGKSYQVTVPSQRMDVEMEADLIEEIARLYGYDRIPADFPSGKPSVTGYQARSFARQVVDVLAHNLREVVTYSFINPRYLSMLNLPEESPLRKAVPIANPLSEEQSVMRTTLLPGLLETCVRNLSRQNEEVAIYEVGNVFGMGSDGQIGQQMMVAGLCTGKTPPTWTGQRREMDFYFLKGVTEHMLGRLGVYGYSWERCQDNPIYHPQRTARVIKEGQELLVMGELHPVVLEEWGIKRRAVAFEARLDVLQSAVTGITRIQEIPRYPSVIRDLAVVLSEDVTAEEMEEVIRGAGGSYLTQITLFDVYRSPQLGEGKKSLAVSLKFQAVDRTLRDEEVSESTRNILQALTQRLGAELR